MLTLVPDSVALCEPCSSKLPLDEVVYDRKGFGRKPKEIFLRQEFRPKAEIRRKTNFQLKEGISAKRGDFGQYLCLSALNFGRNWGLREGWFGRNVLFRPKCPLSAENWSFCIFRLSAEIFRGLQRLPISAKMPKWRPFGRTQISKDCSTEC